MSTEFTPESERQRLQFLVLFSDASLFWDLFDFNCLNCAMDLCAFLKIVLGVPVA